MPVLLPALVSKRCLPAVDCLGSRIPAWCRFLIGHLSLPVFAAVGWLRYSWICCWDTLPQFYRPSGLPTRLGLTVHALDLIKLNYPNSRLPVKQPDWTPRLLTTRSRTTTDTCVLDSLLDYTRCTAPVDRQLDHCHAAVQHPHLTVALVA